MVRRFLGIVVAFTNLTSPLFAQTPSGEISGLATDTSGSVLPGSESL
jgi:hypothetical protein